MATLHKLFKDVGIKYCALGQSIEIDDSLKDAYEEDNRSNIYKTIKPFEDNNKSATPRNIQVPFKGSFFKYFLDGTNMTYYLAESVVNQKKNYPILAAQIRAGCLTREDGRIRLSDDKFLKRQSVILISDQINELDRERLCERIASSELGEELQLRGVTYKVNKEQDPQISAMAKVSAMAKATGIMHRLEIDLIQDVVNADVLAPDQMLAVDGSLQFVVEDTKDDRFGNLFHNVIGITKTLTPNLQIGSSRNGVELGVYLQELQYKQRTHVIRKENSNGRVYGCWYVRIRDINKIPARSRLDGIVGIEKLATKEEEERGFATDVVDNISQSVINENIPTCYGRDKRWANHIYPIYMTEHFIKSSCLSENVFITKLKMCNSF